ncbi:hypothetical protein [Paraburkholderia nemoris]|jgi:hypothetical protein|uniref:hypothetical protein n=1 Tax=Paraburkholderia nemoris TaxID=2793076 RepID=UPI0006B6335B|nr:hypothetical protein [Paraburkholderia nemoris]KPD20113.1 hypothetical protein ADM96_02330 [Burkholderia sp. ST111]MBK5148649.1 hypothetical protein [Burkholderia sp. R-69608]
MVAATAWRSTEGHPALELVDRTVKLHHRARKVRLTELIEALIKIDQLMQTPKPGAANNDT